MNWWCMHVNGSVSLSLLVHYECVGLLAVVMFSVRLCCNHTIIASSTSWVLLNRLTWFERVSMMVILLNCVTLGMYQPCENIDCSSERCQILQVSLRNRIHQFHILPARAVSSHFDALGDIPISPHPLIQLPLPNKIIKLTYKLT